MNGNTAKLVLAVGVTALFTAVILIAAFVGFLYFRTAPEITSMPVSSPGPVAGPQIPARRSRGPIEISPDEIREIRLRRSSMSSTSSNRPAAFFSNINVQNFVSSQSELLFSSDGTATKVVTSEKTVDGVRSSSGPARYAANIGADTFRALAKVLVENDIANEPKSREITSLPISVTLSVVHSRGETVVLASNMGKDTPEMTAVLEAIDELDKRTDWNSASQ